MTAEKLFQPLCRKGIADLLLAEFVLIFLLRLLVFVLLLCQLILPQLLLHFLLPCRVGPFGFIGARFPILNCLRKDAFL